ncbi:MAG TPA: transcriptional regulator [Planctomycetaceae bacterium]|nr:transcriptional regulator [Planctomycetaceae bacterium]
MSESKQERFVECPCFGATLDKLLQPALLAILSRGPSHGYELAQRIGEIPDFFDGVPDVSGVYRLLKMLETRGMVVSEWDLSAGSRARRRFTITEDGRKCLELWSRTLKNYRKAVDSLLKTAEKAIKAVR